MSSLLANYISTAQGNTLIGSVAKKAKQNDYSKAMK